MVKFYAVKEGRRPGIYTSWDQAKAQVDKYPGAVHKKFNVLSGAQEFMGDPSARIYGSYTLPPWEGECSNTATLAGRDSKRFRSDDDDVVWVATKRPTHLLADSSSRATSSRAVAESSTPSLLIYTDGSCLGNRNVETSNCPAGWAAVAVDPLNSSVAVAELYGPVITPSVRKAQPHLLPFDSGAEVGSNNTGELCGILEALLWVRSHFSTSPSTTATNGGRRRIVEIRYDSEYAKKVVTGEYQAAKNVALVNCAKRALQDLASSSSSSSSSSAIAGRSGAASYASGRPTYSTSNGGSRGVEVRFQHVKGHSGDFWNDRADELAKQGAAGRVCAVGRWSLAGSL